MADPAILAAALPADLAPRVSALAFERGEARAVLDIGGFSPAEASAAAAHVRAALGGVAGVTAVRLIETAERATPETHARPRRIVAVASGKGGVGKSTVAANLAVALARRGLSVGLLDADIHGPSVPMLMGVTARAELKDKRIQPIMAHGVATLSMGMMTDPDRAVAWRGPMASAAMAQMVSEADWGALDLLVIDMPPGTGDITLTLAQKVKPDGVVIVSTPQDLALIDAKRALALFRQLGTPVLGLVENMSLFTCPHCAQTTAIFGEGGVEAAAAVEGLPMLARLPLEPAIRAASDAGRPLPGAAFDDLAVAVLGALEAATRASPSRQAAGE